MMFIQRPINVDATSWRCIDIVSTLRARWDNPSYQRNLSILLYQSS